MTPSDLNMTWFSLGQISFQIRFCPICW